MAANQKSEDFKIEDWAIPEAELPWNILTAVPSGKPQSANIIELDQYWQQKRDNQAAD